MKQHRMKAYLYKLEVARGCAVIDNCFEQVAIIIRSQWRCVGALDGPCEFDEDG